MLNRAFWLFLGIGLVVPPVLAQTELNLSDDAVVDNESFDTEYYDEAWQPPRRPNWRSMWVCIGRDAGWEEHRGGHQMIARNYRQAWWAAQNECRRFHHRCTVTCRERRYR